MADDENGALIVPCTRGTAKKWFRLKNQDNYASDVLLLNHLLQLYGENSAAKRIKTEVDQDFESGNPDFEATFINESELSSLLKRAPRQRRNLRSRKSKAFPVLPDPIVTADDSLEAVLKAESDSLDCDLNDISLGNFAEAQLGEAPEIDSVKIRKSKKSVKKKVDKTVGKAGAIQCLLYVCPLCGSTFPGQSAVLEHVLDKHKMNEIGNCEPGGIFKCSVCSGDVRYDEFRTHYDFHVAVVLKCAQCEEICTAGPSWGKHVKQCAGPNPNRYNYSKDYFCFYTRGRPANAKNGTEVVKMAGMQCRLCNKKYISEKHRMIQHIRKHRGLTPYVCELCGRGFVAKLALDRHVRNLHKEKDKQCHLCGQFFSRNTALTSHMQDVHQNIRVRCDVCDKPCLKRLLRAHRQTHFDEFKTWICDTCGKTFRRKIQLQAHQDIHTGLRKYACKICSQTYPQKSGVAQHYKNRHPGRKPEIVTLPITTSSLTEEKQDKTTDSKINAEEKLLRTAVPAPVLGFSLTSFGLESGQTVDQITRMMY